MSDEQPEPEVKMKRPKLVSVRVVSVDKQTGTALVEYANGQKRALVPSDAIGAGMIGKDDLEAGLSYGVPWEDMKFEPIDPAALAHELRAAGVWTCDDLANKVAVVTGILARISGAHRANLVAFARQNK